MTAYTDRDGNSWKLHTISTSGLEDSLWLDLCDALAAYRAMREERDRLERWKADALSVIDRWDDIADDMPATFLILGARRSDCVAAYIDHLQAEVEHLRTDLAYSEHLRVTK